MSDTVKKGPALSRPRRREVLTTAALAVASALLPAAAQGRPAIALYRTTGCSCCELWAKRMEQAGFKVVTTDLAPGRLMRMKLDAGLKPEHASCHTAKIEGFTIEGHVPVREIERLLLERLSVAGLAVPGMPLGSPGMEAGSKADAYDVLLFRADGSTEIYASYTARS